MLFPKNFLEKNRLDFLGKSCIYFWLLYKYIQTCLKYSTKSTFYKKIRKLEKQQQSRFHRSFWSYEKASYIHSLPRLGPTSSSRSSSRGHFQIRIQREGRRGSGVQGCRNRRWRFRWSKEPTSRRRHRWQPKRDPWEQQRPKACHRYPYRCRWILYWRHPHSPSWTCRCRRKSPFLRSGKIPRCRCLGSPWRIQKTRK